MNTMFYTKVLGGVCGSLLVLLLLKWAASAYYLPEAAHGEHAEAAYAIEVEESHDVVEEVEVPFADLLAMADAGAGARVFNKCKSCHKIGEGEHSTGPSLFGIVGRSQGSTDFGSYSDAMASLGGDWTPESLNEFITRPSAYAPGTGMSFAGLSKENDRANLIAYLATLQ
ncbi:MAG: cytochrome c family protein [Rhodobacteraceae bacterium]|nr:cytochrome c family protein [Paracoccaceae bacterium]